MKYPIVNINGKDYMYLTFDAEYGFYTALDRDGNVRNIVEGKDTFVSEVETILDKSSLKSSYQYDYLKSKKKQTVKEFLDVKL